MYCTFVCICFAFALYVVCNSFKHPHTYKYKIPLLYKRAKGSAVDSGVLRVPEHPRNLGVQKRGKA